MYFLWKQDIGVGHRAGRNYSRKGCIDVFLAITWWQKGDWIVVQQLNSFHGGPELCDPDLWPLGCGQWEWDELKTFCLFAYTFFVIAHRCRFGSVIVFASITKLKGLTEWFHSVHGSWDRESKTAYSHLISAQPFPRPNTAGAPGKWEWRNITFLFRLRGMWHSVDGFCRIGSAKARLSCWRQVSCFFHLLKQECRLVNWLALIRLVQVPITVRPHRSWTEIAPLQYSLDMYLTRTFKQICVYLKWSDWTEAVAVFCY